MSSRERRDLPRSTEPKDMCVKEAAWAFLVDAKTAVCDVPLATPSHLKGGRLRRIGR